MSAARFTMLLDPVLQALRNPVVLTFAAYLIFLLAVGLYFCGKNRRIEDYLLGGRAMGAWVTALSAQASDMSGWLLMGLPGAIYLRGLPEVWIAVGLLVGTGLNWALVAGRLRVATQETDTITLPCFFEARFGDPTGLLRVLSALIILIFFTIYASSGLVATGKLFESTFGLSYRRAVIIGGGIIIAYTFLGGFLAVCWTDLIQGLLMVAALVLVPLLALRELGGSAAIREGLTARGIAWSLIPRDTARPWLAIVSAAAWGLGYFGQPHILARFMSVRSLGKLHRSAVIAMIWVVISLAGAVCVGLLGIGLFADLGATGEAEKVFIHMIPRVMGPWLGGVMLAAILSAIMSTIDSQLLVSSSALTEDLYQRVIRRDASQRQLLWIGRIGVIVISAVALLLALNPRDSILGIVAYAWGGFGAAFGPVVLAALYAPRISWLSALLGMTAGAVTLVVWKEADLGPLFLGGPLYEIVPGFAANVLTILISESLLRGRREGRAHA